MKQVYLIGPVICGSAFGHFCRVEASILHRASRENVSIVTEKSIMTFPPNDNWILAKKICISRLIKIDGVALLQGWQNSKWVRLELKLAQELHIPVVYVEPPADSTELNELFLAAPETLRYYNLHLSNPQQEYLSENTIENVLARLANRYLDPHGFEYIDIMEGE